ncbi:MAG: DNA-directed RNA polymerase subunit alpha [Candidatus Nomurabacteria bacterium GW2011_GWA1_46_11]|uniref:DNA-directed RNA polymerase subunit alpha n=2 Tax=Parcubacteria group TaxID=1794811 RepID=A0A1G1YV63_9BACT|nr:MAG: DNA-directed RNA polymerase subunit alpha [Parcubacteria group bacterium GW2011_GWA2_46_10]KKU22150.1 MAG: DNA-directed RNA polymerase subunit alpha [Candidatus Nomurabacteria bacterium GW2011_GWA1_46_11]OGY56204.1 MAG: DNA-directed RNA polymerase subunit alpha [Candidatus Colwellbacteria bacterium GWA2_46_10]
MDYTYLSETVKIKKVSEDERNGVFEIEGLFRGYGLTIGNALRRVLLSSLPGAAITRFTVKGAGHEFTTIPGMVEDVVELGLNLKQVKFAFYAEGPQELFLRFKGEGDVKAKDITDSAQVRVMNPDLHIATLSTKGAELDIVLTVEKGLGYVPVEAQKTERLPVGTIALDAVFSPVVNVNYTVENMRVGDRTDYNRVRVEIETDGTVSPSSALHKAANILIDHLKKVVDVEVVQAKEEKASKKEKKAEEPKEEVKEK